jgi:hypothetical protein
VHNQWDMNLVENLGWKEMIDWLYQAQSCSSYHKVVSERGVMKDEKPTRQTTLEAFHAQALTGQQ